MPTVYLAGLAAFMLIELKGNDLLKLRDAQGVTIHVHAGRVWLTEEGKRSDAFLNAGSRYIVEGNGLVLVESLAFSPKVLR